MNADGLFKSQIIRQVEKCIRARLCCLWCSYTVLLAYRQSMMMLEKKKKKGDIWKEHGWQKNSEGKGIALPLFFSFTFISFDFSFDDYLFLIIILNFHFFFRIHEKRTASNKILRYLLLLEAESIYNFIVTAVLSTSTGRIQRAITCHVQSRIYRLFW